MQEKFKNLPLRIGVGIILLNRDSKVFVAKRLDNPNKEVSPVSKEKPGVGLNRQIAKLIISTKTESAGTNLLILRS